MSEAMSQAAAPVVILRWFAEGAGYAYDSTIEAGRVSVTSEALARIFQTHPSGSAFTLPMASGGWIVGDKIEDAACLDAKAAGREPAIVRAVLLEERPKPRREAALLERLRSLRLPTHPGPTQLAVVLPQPPRIDLPSPAQPYPRLLMQWGPAAGALVMLMLEAYLGSSADSAHSFVAWVLRLALLALVIATCYFWLPAQASREHIRDVESRLHGADEDDGSDPCRGVFAGDARIVLPDGQKIRLDTIYRQGAASGFNPASLAITESQYLDFVNGPGRATLMGKEKIRWENTAEKVCWFIRQYERIHGQWQITFAQWTVKLENTR